MIDFAIDELGPELDLLKETLLEQGKRHVRYGVRPDSLRSMTNAVISAVKGLLGDEFTDEHEQAWRVVFQLFSTYMVEGMDQELNYHCLDEDLESGMHNPMAAEFLGH